MLFFLTLAPLAAAAPEPIVWEFEEGSRVTSGELAVRRVHDIMEPQSPDVSESQMRYALLQGMINTKGYAWRLEGEGPGYILARFDHRLRTIVMRIEYTTAAAQLKLHSTSPRFPCRNLTDDGVCLKHVYSYYNYAKNLRFSINKMIQEL